MNFNLPFFKRNKGLPASTPDQPPSEDAVAKHLTGTLLKDVMTELAAQRRWRLYTRGLYVMLVLVAIAYATMQANGGSLGLGVTKPSVAVVAIRGAIFGDSIAGAAKVIPAIKKAFESEEIKGVILKIDSGGGAPSEAERISTLIGEMRRKHPKPVIAVVDSVGASAAYLIAVSADSIVAGRYSLVGSIGAILTGWDAHKTIRRIDLEQKVYASGSLKGMLNQFSEATPAGEAKAQALVDDIGRMFLAQVVERRGAKLAQGVDFGTGEAWTGAEAKELGLIDHLGTEELAVSMISKGEDLEVLNLGPTKGGSGILSSYAADMVETIITRVAWRASAVGLTPAQN